MRYIIKVIKDIQNIHSICTTSEEYKTRVWDWIAKHSTEMSENDIYISDVIEIAEEISGEDW